MHTEAADASPTPTTPETPPRPEDLDAAEAPSSATMRAAESDVREMPPVAEGLDGPETSPRPEDLDAAEAPSSATMRAAESDVREMPPVAGDLDGPETSPRPEDLDAAEAPSSATMRVAESDVREMPPVAEDSDGPETRPRPEDPDTAETSSSDVAAPETPLHSSDLGEPGTPLGGAGAGAADSDSDFDGPKSPSRSADSDGTPLFSRALLALTAAATIAVSPIAAAAIGPADSGQSAHSVPVYLISRISHDVGHNDWAFQGQDAGRVSWVITYVSLALLWLGVSLWIRTRMRTHIRMRRADAPEPRRVRLWLRVLIAAWAAELVTGLLTLAAGAYAEWTSTPVGADVLKAADLCTPWWSCVAAVLVVARAERSATALRAIGAYGVLLIVVLLLPLPGPDALKALLIALPAAIPALLTQRQQAAESDSSDPNAPVTQGAIATG